MDPKSANYGPGTIDAIQVRKDIDHLRGKSATVCGRVNSQAWSMKGKGPLNVLLGSSTPPDFWIVLSNPQDWAVDGDFGKVACVTGVIEEGWSKAWRVAVPQIVVTSPKQLQIKNVPARF